MTFFITGLVCWAGILLGEMHSATDMLILTIVPVFVITFLCVKAKKEPSRMANSIFGQIILAGICNGMLMAILGKNAVYVGIPLNVILMSLVLYARMAKLFRRKQRHPNAYQQGYRDGKAAQQSQ